MKLHKKALLYDIANMAYIIADNHSDSDSAIHRLRDICQEGNIDRVSRVLGLAYANLLQILAPILTPGTINEHRDHSAQPHDYLFKFNECNRNRYRLTDEIKLKIKETAHEYMICMVLADWLAVILPAAADVWKFRFEQASLSIKEIVASITSGVAAAFSRSISPF